MSEPLNGTETAGAQIVPAGTRDPSTGRFGPGNPGGGRRKMPIEIREMLEAATPLATQRLIEALDATKVVHYQGVECGVYVDHEMRKQAALAIYERLYGKTPQAIAFEDEDGNATLVPGIVFLPSPVKP